MCESLKEAVAAPGAKSALARDIGAHPQEVWNWANGRPVPPARRPLIERALYPRITVEALGADVRWVRVPDESWPHPEGRPCLDVVASATAAPAAQPQEMRDAA